MHYKAVLKVVGVLFGLFSITLLPPLFIAFFAKDGAFFVFLISLFITLFLGVLFWFPVRYNQEQLGVRDGFLAVAAFWVSLGLAGSLPFLVSQDLQVGVTDAMFESMSGLTTTGATVFTNIEDLPMSIKYYRQQLQWLGGMGIIVLAVAVMPILGIGGMELYSAEMPGLTRNTKLTPRIKETAKALWYIYLGLTILCALAYWAAGMSKFDAISHAYSTIAIGGFSTYDASMGAFDNVKIMYVGVIFMILAGINFSLHFRVWHKDVRIWRKGFRVWRKDFRIWHKDFRIWHRDVRVQHKGGIRHYIRDGEFRVYILILAVSVVLMCLVLLFMEQFEQPLEVIHHGVFQVVSMATTSGFATTDFASWPLFLPAMLLALSMIGGCTGSTAGGMKVVRVMLLFKQGRREITQLIHPNAVLLIRLNGQPLSDRVVNSVWGFFALYTLSFVTLSLAMLATGTDLVTSYSTVTACLNNLGPALGDAAVSYQNLPNSSKWILAFTMLLGRLELLTILILLSPNYWRD